MSSWQTCACSQGNGKISTLSKQFHNQEAHAQHSIGEFKLVKMAVRNHMLGCVAARRKKTKNSETEWEWKKI